MHTNSCNSINFKAKQFIKIKHGKFPEKSAYVSEKT